MEWEHETKDRWECLIADGVIVLTVERRRIKGKYQYTAGVQTGEWHMHSATTVNSLQDAQDQALQMGKDTLEEALEFIEEALNPPVQPTP